jgi:hypothetical protein
MDEPRPTLTVILGEFLRARPNQWVDGRQIAKIAGFAGWRARISDLRKAPYAMTISNRQRNVRVDEHTTFRVTEYRYEPPAAAEYLNIHSTPHQPGLWS